MSAAAGCRGGGGEGEPRWRRPWKLLALGLLSASSVLAAAPGAGAMSKEEKRRLGNQVLEMFDHAYSNYMDHAYPADELMPLTCRGRVRGQEPSRGDVDDALGKSVFETLNATPKPLGVYVQLAACNTCLLLKKILCGHADQ